MYFWVLLLKLYLRWSGFYLLLRFFSNFRCYHGKVLLFKFSWLCKMKQEDFCLLYDQGQFQWHCWSLMDHIKFSREGTSFTWMSFLLPAFLLIGPRYFSASSWGILVVFIFSENHVIYLSFQSCCLSLTCSSISRLFKLSYVLHHLSHSPWSLHIYCFSLLSSITPATCLTVLSVFPWKMLWWFITNKFVFSLAILLILVFSIIPTFWLLFVNYVHSKFLFICCLLFFFLQ